MEPDIEQTETEEKISLLQRITNLSYERPVGPINPPQGTIQEFCVICGSPRLRPDPVGLTCGQTKCLLTLGQEYQEKEVENLCKEQLKEIAEKLGLNPESLSDEFDKACKEINDHIKGLLDMLRAAAEDNLGLSSLDESEINVSDLSEKIFEETQRIAQAIKRL